jgi:PKD domain-containing protein/CHAP domain-containing protein
MTSTDQSPRRKHRRWLRMLAPSAALALATSLVVPALAGAPAVAAVTANPPAAPTVHAAGATAADGTALIRAFVLARKLPRDAVGGIAKGSLHVATGQAGGTAWAVASFTPSAKVAPRLNTEFQDGASTAVFTRSRGHAWRLSQLTGAPFVCSRALSPALLSAWHLRRLASCGVSAATQRSAALRARPGTTAGVSIGQNIANIALSEIGIADSPANTSFSPDCDPYSTMDGPTAPNANGCGVNSNFGVVNENEEWCADFAKWVWQQAGVTADVPSLNAGAISFYKWGLEQGESMPVDSASPAVGDAIVLFPPGTVNSSTTFADHVGIVTSVNSDGTVDLANGDFAGPSNISVQYNTEIPISGLASWAASVEGDTGEQYVFVAPPNSTQQAAPTARIVAPGNAVAGTSVPLTAEASEADGSISSYLWTFGDGITATGASVTHVFGDPGLYTAALTATSSLGTETTTTATIDVVGGSDAVSSIQGDQVWYTTDPLLQNVYTARAGTLSEDGWDGASWLDQTVPGAPSGTSAATLTYPGTSDQFSAAVFFRAGAGTLAETSGGDGDWSTSQLAGQPSASSAIAATTVNDATSPRGAAPDVFYFSSSGQPSESSGVGGIWSTQTLPGPLTTASGSLALTNTTQGGTPSQALFYIDGGALTVDYSGSSGWQTEQISLPSGIAAGSPLSALTSGPGGLTESVFFVDGSGKLAQATSAVGSGTWTVTELPGPAASTDGLTSANYQLASGATSPEVFYIDTSGQPVEDSQTGSAWQSSTLPGTATGVIGVGAYPSAGGAQQLFLADGQAVTEDSVSAAGGSWTTNTLPTTAATYAGRIMLYAASSSDYANALSAASEAGLPAGQVTDNFDVAFAATASGNYLVIAVGVPAVDALYVNDCGWANPSGDDAGTTPFYYQVAPWYGLPGVDAFVNATAKSSSKAVAAAKDATYYALNDKLPAGVTSMPALTGSNNECEGSPS